MNEQILEDAETAGFEIHAGGGISWESVDVKEELTKFAELTKARAIHDVYVLLPINPSEAMIEKIMHEWNAEGHKSLAEKYATIIKAAQQERN